MKRLLSLLTVVTFVAIPNYSYAQNAELVLEEVVVTATKKEENVQDIAQTVNAVTGSTLDDYQIRDLSELAQVVSGVEFTKIDPRRATIIMRGQKLDPDGGNDQPIQGYIDEVPLRAQDVFSQMYDTERVEILKALYKGAKILILDEPTGVLTPQETEELFRIFGALKKQGVTIVLITHKLREIMAITDQVSVMRAGQMVAHKDTKETSRAELAELMVGRKVLLQVHKNPANVRAPLMKVKHLTIADKQGVERLKDVSFELRAGEVLGVAGVSGNGQTELLEALSGIVPMTSGTPACALAAINSRHSAFVELREYLDVPVPK